MCATSILSTSAQEASLPPRLRWLLGCQRDLPRLLEGFNLLVGRAAVESSPDCGLVHWLNANEDQVLWAVAIFALKVALRLILRTVLRDYKVNNRDIGLTDKQGLVEMVSEQLHYETDSDEDDESDEDDDGMDDE